MVFFRGLWDTHLPFRAPPPPRSALIQYSHDPATYPKDGGGGGCPETIAYSISISPSWLKLPLQRVRMCTVDLLGPRRRRKEKKINCFHIWLYWDEWGNVLVLISCAVITSIMSAVAVCFQRHYVDAGYSHTLWYGYIFLLFQGCQPVTTSLIIIVIIACSFFSSQSFHYSWVFCSFSCLRRGSQMPSPPSSPPKNKKIKTVTTTEGVLKTLSLHFGEGVLGGCSAELAVHILIFCDWLLGPSECLRITQPPPCHLQCRCLSDCSSSSSSSFYSIITCL